MLEINTKEKEKYDRMVREINDNDFTALEPKRNSRWTIWEADKAGKFKNVSAEMRAQLDYLADSCKESL